MEYRREIDGLRALAVLPVILFHAGFEQFSGGFVGVDIFFVISGYLITSIILEDLAVGRFSLLAFYERRARRILPALFLVVAASLPFAWFWMPPSDLKDFSQSLVAVSLFTSNVLFWLESGYFATAAELKPLLHTWSLAVEEQFYILFPLLLILCRRRPLLPLITTLLLVSLAVSQWSVSRQPDAAFFLLHARAWELLLGALIALYLRRPCSLIIDARVYQAGSILGFVMILIAIFVYTKSVPFPGFYALLPTIGAALLILCAKPETLVGKLLCSPPFVGVGLISYSAYLWHQPIFAFARHRSLDGLSDGTLLALVALTLGLSYITWRYVETPWRRKDLIPRRTVFVASTVIALAFVSVGVSGHLSEGFKGRGDEKFIETIERVTNTKHQQQSCWDRLIADPHPRQACSFGDGGTVPTVAVIGDSHAGALMTAFDEIARKYDRAGKNFTFTDCPPLRDSFSARDDETRRTCKAFRKVLFDQLNTKDVPDILILTSRWTFNLEQTRFDNLEGGAEAGDLSTWTHGDAQRDGRKQAIGRDYKESIEYFLKNGKQVVLIYPVPEMGWNVPNRLLRLHEINGQLLDGDASTNYETFKARNSDTYAALDAVGDHPMLARVYPEAVLCDTLIRDRCVAHINGVPLYFDDDHLSHDGARMVIQEVAKVLGWTDDN